MRLLYIFLILIIFTGCSSQHIVHPNENVTLTEEESADDELFDDFEDETEIEDSYDPLNGYNRVMTTFNDNLLIHVFTPVSKTYNAVVHYEIRDSVSKFFRNLYYPPRLVNNLLQGKLVNSFEETERFIINTTVGVLGLFDPAKSYFGIEAHNEDFGQTLGFYGVGTGPHIVLPLFGPSNLRDLFGMLPDSYLSPIDYADREWFTLTDNWVEYLSVRTYEQTNEFSLNINQYETVRKDAVDLYPYLRDIYEQFRANQIKE